MTAAPEEAPQSRWDSLIESWLGTSKRKPWAIVLGLIAVTAIAAPFAARLKVSTNLKKLLPENTPAVQHLNVASAKLGDLGYFSLIIENDDTDESIRFANAFVERISKSDYVRTVLYENPVDFLREYRFVLLDADELEKIRDYILAARRKSSGFNLNLLDDEEEEEEPAPEDNGDERTTDDFDMEALKEQYNKLENAKKEHVSKDGKVVAMQIRPTKSTMGLGFLRKMRKYLLEEANTLKKEGNYSENMGLFVAGSLQNQLDEYGTIVGDLLRSAWVSGLLILGVLFAFFRKPSAVFLVLVPLIMGLVWTFATAQITIGYLNTVSAMLFVVLFGLGIDHGIHLVKRIVQERQKGSDLDESLRQAMGQTGRAVWISALTTAGGFFLMLIVDFRGFSHLGFVAGTAMLLITSGYFVATPAVAYLFDRGGFLKSFAKVNAGGLPWLRFGQSLANAPVVGGVAIMALLVGVGSWTAFNLDFNDDFDTLYGKIEAREIIKAKQTKVYTQSLTPGAVMFAQDDATLTKLLAALEERKATDTESPTIGDIVSIHTFLPPDQDKRMELIEDAARLVTPYVLKTVKKDDRDMFKILKSLRRSAELEPITMETVPSQIKNYFKPQDGTDDKMVFIYTRKGLSRKHGEEAIAFASDMGPLEVDGQTFHAAGHTLIFAEIIRLVITQGLLIFALSLLAIAVLVGVQFRDLRTTINVLLALFGGLGLMVLVIRVTGITINMYNMAIFAAVVGMGIDSAIHLGSRWVELSGTGSERLAKTVDALGGSVTACAMTTVAGYAGMIFSHHPGLQSIGQLAVAGLVSCWLVALTVFPIYLRKFGHS